MMGFSFGFICGGWSAHGEHWSTKTLVQGTNRGKEVWVISLCEIMFVFYPTWHAFVWKVEMQINQIE